MGVDYDANYGIGFQIARKELNDEYDCMEDFLDDNLKDGFEYFETGSENYSGVENRLFVCIEKPFENGFFGLKTKAEELKEHLEELGLEPEGEIDLVGGLHIW